MSGTRQTQFTVSGQSTDWKDPDAARVYIERIMEPVFKRVRNTVNQLARDWIHVTASQLIDAKFGLVLVDATAGAVTLTIPAPEDMFHPIVVVKTDASGNSVTVQARDGALINGAATDTITSRWDIAAYEGDEDQYVKVSTGNIALGGDVTGSASANTVSKLQTILLTIGAPATGDVLMYDGTQITPTPLKIRVLDTTYSPVGLWNMHLGAGVGIKDYSGNGNDMIVEGGGTLRYTALMPALGGILFDGSTNALVNSAQAVLRVTGAMTILALGSWSDLPTAGNVRAILSHAAAGETSDTNYLYRFAVDEFNQCDYFSEHGAGVNDSAKNNTFSPRAQVWLLGVTRSSGGVLNFWYNGTTVGASFGTVTLPTDGSTGRCRMGGGPGGAGEFYTGVLSSVGLYDTELDGTKMLERYNYTMGRQYGFR